MSEADIHAAAQPGEADGPITDHDMEAWFGDNMLFSDPPQHTRLRRLARAACTPNDIEGMRGAIRGRVDDLLDGLARAGGGEFIELVALPLPLGVIADLLGIPAEDRSGPASKGRQSGRPLGATTI